MKFELPTELSSIIKVIGVGGGGSNAVNHMHAQGISGVDFIICNTDKQALDISKIPVKLQIGAALTEGLGAGSIPERGSLAAQENIDEIRQLLSKRTKMLFITAGMGGGTGTGAAPVIARIARDMGVLTVGIVTMPFAWEGRKRKLQAGAGIEEMRNSVDTLLVINNDRLRDLYGNLTMDDAFAHADNVLTTAARGIAEIITKTGKVNVDFEDVRTVMSSSGVAIMGMAEAEGEDRAIRAAQEALSSPLLNDSDIKGAKFVLLNIALGDQQMQMDEMTEITDHIQDAAGSTADVIWGYCHDESLGKKLRVTVIATGFNQNPLTEANMEHKPLERKIVPLGDITPTIITAPIANPVTGAPAPKPVPAPPKEEPVVDYVVKTIPKAPEPAPVVPEVKVTAPAPEVKAAPLPEVKVVAPALEVKAVPVPELKVTPVVPEVKATPAPEVKVTPMLPEVKVTPPAPAPEPVVEEVKQEQRPIEFEVSWKPEEKVVPEVRPEPVVAVQEEKTVHQLAEAEVAPAAVAAPTVLAAPAPVMEPLVATSTQTVPVEAKTDPQDHQMRVEERLARMREMTMRLRSPSGLSDLEREPAFKRKNPGFSDVPHSSESNVSRYTLSEETDENGDRSVQLKKNNPHLHDQPD